MGCICIFLIISFQKQFAPVSISPENGEPETNQTCDVGLSECLFLEHTSAAKRIRSFSLLRNDFVNPDGSLPVHGAEEIIPTINKLISGCLGLACCNQLLQRCCPVVDRLRSRICVFSLLLWLLKTNFYGGLPCFMIKHFFHMKQSPLRVDWDLISFTEASSFFFFFPKRHIFCFFWLVVILTTKTMLNPFFWGLLWVGLCSHFF